MSSSPPSSSPKPISDMLRDFADCRMVKATLPLTGESALHLDGVIKDFSETSLEIQFPNQTLPVADLASEGRWRITFDKGLSFLTVWGRLALQITPQRVRLDLVGSETNHYARRDHRVDTEIYLRYWQAGDGRQELPPHRTRVNLSGYGLSFSSENRLAANSLVELELFLPGATLERVRCVGRVIRDSGQAQQHSTTALELVNLTQDDIEKIINFCMTEQFRAMQQKARMLADSMGPENS